MDARDRNYNLHGVVYDEQRMIIDIEGEEHPAKFEVCGLCGGRGSHVNPSIDSHGLSNDDFAEDPDFKEAYFSGAYDVPCACCQGKRVELVPSKAEGREALADVANAAAEIQAEYEAERRMGA
jgi:hypothetical protein